MKVGTPHDRIGKDEEEVFTKSEVGTASQSLSCDNESHTCVSRRNTSRQRRAALDDDRVTHNYT